MRNLDGYPDSFGSHRAAIYPIAGPASYVQLVEGVAPACATGGQLVEAKACGMKYFEYMDASLTDSGKYRVDTVPTLASGVITSNNPSAGQPALTYRLRWTVVATGNEVGAGVNLSAEIIRVSALGPK